MAWAHRRCDTLGALRPRVLRSQLTRNSNRHSQPMQYFDNALADQTFRVIASRLQTEVDGAQRRLDTITDEQAGAPRAAGKWSRKQILGHLIDSAANNHQRFVRAQAVTALRLPG